MVCVRERVCVCVYTFNDVPLGFSSIIQVFHLVLNFIQCFSYLIFMLRGRRPARRRLLFPMIIVWILIFEMSAVETSALFVDYI